MTLDRDTRDWLDGETSTSLQAIISHAANVLLDRGIDKIQIFPPPPPPPAPEAPLKGQRPSLAYLAHQIASEGKVTVAQLKGTSRLACIFLSRHRLMYEAYEAGHTLTAIGRFLNRDHSTVGHGRDRHIAAMAAASRKRAA